MENMASVTAETITNRLRAGDDDLFVLDIRHADEFDDWHIPGSTNIDVYDALKNNPDDARNAFQDLPDSKEIVTVCGVGVVSATAEEVLRDMGYHAKTLEDGLRGWSRVHVAAPVPLDIAGTLHQVARPGTGCLSYVLISAGDAVIIDPSQYIAEYEALIDDYTASIAAVVETHAHADHVSGARQLATETDVPYYLHPGDAGNLTTTTPLADEAVLEFGDVSATVIHTPGHTPGSVTLRIGDEALLTGDTLFIDSVGRPDLEGGTKAELRERAATLHDSLSRILDHPPGVQVAPAHDPGSPAPPTTASLEVVKSGNELLSKSRSAFIEAITDSIPPTPANHERIKRANTGKEPISAEDAKALEIGPNRCAAE